MSDNPALFANGTKPIPRQEAEWGKPMLIAGLVQVINRGRLSAGMSAVDLKDHNDLIEAWYDALIDTVPCQHWKEVGLWASRYTKPVDKFTLGQFFEAWAKFCEQGRARGYEPWR